jgi:hypothetical protein
MRNKTASNNKIARMIKREKSTSYGNRSTFRVTAAICAGRRIQNRSFTSESSGVLWRQLIDGSAPAQVTNFTTDRIFNFAFSPDDSQLALPHR